MSSLIKPLVSLNKRSVQVIAVRYQRTPFRSKPIRGYEERNKDIIEKFSDRGLKLAKPTEKPQQYEVPLPPPDPKILTRERKLPGLGESGSPYHKYSQENINAVQKYETYYDPLFNPNLLDERHKVNPDEEPFDAIYQDSKSGASKDYTGVRNITTSELWDYVECLKRIKVAPEVVRRKSGEELKPMPSGFYPPPQSAPDLPYFIPRTRNHLLPVYFKLDSDPNECITLVGKIDGDLWQFEEDLRTHLEATKSPNRRILTSVQETDAKVIFRGRHLHEIVDWLHKKGF